MWAAVLDAPASLNSTRVYVAENTGEMGFGACGDQRDDALRERGFAGEIGAIYILRSQQGAGVGRALMSLMAHDLAARLMPGASLWVLRENVGARGFYKGLGGAIIFEKEVAKGDATLHEVAYGWPDLAHLF
ncbi:GNAT family N-acetyltransferase [Novosphingobium sp. KCTC 2891]|uniref:GNAT family N-acetyltransferase n=1 Tax=Novosphingobium sp. KCTC 2891 TaxID=2989730 RepID=UPI0022230FF6|nr:GNAT family N-acetyltransferase [Novosphingobium sp. KCTC 2891]MCW1381976.1 GNAT family N-acetyltransferase [Novosphingobium sp. KCTC 2891]